MVLIASSQLMRTQPGSSSPRAFVRFMGGTDGRGGTPPAATPGPCRNGCPWSGTRSSPSVRMARPFSTMTHTPHSILPQPRQHERTRLVSPALLWVALLDSANAAPVGATTAAAAAVAAASFVNARRVIFSLPMLSSFSRPLAPANTLQQHRVAGRKSSLGRSPEHQATSPALPPTCCAQPLRFHNASEDSGCYRASKSGTRVDFAISCNIYETFDLGFCEL